MLNKLTNSKRVENFKSDMITLIEQLRIKGIEELNKIYEHLYSNWKNHV